MKASALLCPACCVEYVEVEFDFEVDGVILHNVKALRCPTCEEEVFTPEQYEAIRKRVSV
jgi:autonomous glycyl radical cofactor GrcA